MALPGDDVQRGGLLRSVGDPETPGLPSVDYAPRVSIPELRDSGILPSIPATPVGSDAAASIMRLLDGPVIMVTTVFHSDIREFRSGRPLARWLARRVSLHGLASLSALCSQCT